LPPSFGLEFSSGSIPTYNIAANGKKLHVMPLRGWEGFFHEDAPSLVVNEGALLSRNDLASCRAADEKL
jgi:hypothetical protein